MALFDVLVYERTMTRYRLEAVSEEEAKCIAEGAVPIGSAKEIIESEVVDSEWAVEAVNAVEEPHEHGQAEH